MSQQIILEMEKKYPFQQVQYYSSDMKIFVRKIIKYNKQNYKTLKQKFEIVKKLTNINIIKLIKILEQQNKFHLLYEYVPYKLNHIKTKSKQFFQNIKSKLIFLSSFFFCNKIATKFDIADIGLDRKYQLKYYLDINFQIIESDQETIQIQYLNDTNKLNYHLTKFYNDNNQSYKTFDNKNRKYNSKNNRIQINKPEANEEISFKKKQNYVKRIQQRESNFKKRQISHNNNQRRQDKSRQKSIQSLKSNNTMQILTNIESKIDILRQNMKKSSSRIHLLVSKETIKVQNVPAKTPKILNQQDDDKEFGESVRQKTNIKKLDHRKYSEDAALLSPFLKKTFQLSKISEMAKSAHTHQQNLSNVLQRINETSEQYHYRKQSQEIKNYEIQQSKLTQSHDLNQKEFKGKQYKNLHEQKKQKNSIQVKKKYDKTKDTSNEKYVQQFLDILEDEQSIKINVSRKNLNTVSTTSILNSQYNNNSRQYQIKNDKLTPNFIQKINNQNRKNNHFNYSNKFLNQDEIFTPKSLSNIIKHQSSKEKEQNLKKSIHLSRELKTRISKAIQKSDQALEKYRKLSTHSITTEFGKNKK